MKVLFVILCCFIFCCDQEQNENENDIVNKTWMKVGVDSMYDYELHFHKDDTYSIECYGCSDKWDGRYLLQNDEILLDYEILDAMVENGPAKANYKYIFGNELILECVSDPIARRKYVLEGGWHWLAM